MKASYEHFQGSFPWPSGHWRNRARCISSCKVADAAVLLLETRLLFEAEGPLLQAALQRLGLLDEGGSGSSSFSTND